MLSGVRKGDIVVMDNMRSHHVKGVEEVLRAAGMIPLYLPPYSPDLNPIEMLWSKMKAILRKWAATLLHFCPRWSPRHLLSFRRRIASAGFTTDGY